MEDKDKQKIEEKLQNYAVNVSMKMLDETAGCDGSTRLALIISGTGLALDYIFQALAKGNKAQINEYWGMVKEALEIAKEQRI